MNLRIEGLSKTYGNGVKAPNGAGKSSLMRTIATLQEPDSGSIHLGTINVLRQKDELRRVLGYLPQDFGVYPRTSAQDMLDHLALLKGMTHAGQRKEAVAALLMRVNLYDQRKKALTGFSGGMRQRFGIAQALLGSPRLLIVDEPTAGLDPGERNRFYNLLAEIGENVTVILSTHIVQDVMELCTNMAIIHNGRVLYSGAPDAAVHSLQGRIWQRFIPKQELKEYEARYKVISTKLIGGRPLVHIFSPEAPEPGFEPIPADLEDVFFSHIQGLAPGASTARL